MTKANKTRSALLMSVLSMLLCVSMLVGTTFAWFTDTAATGINTITAGNLDIEVLYAYPSDVVNGEIPDNAWKTVNAQTPVFNPDALWEPGYTEVVYLKYVNKGSLSLQFQMHVDIVKETEGTNVAGNKFNLSDYIEAYVCGAVDYQFELYETRDEALNPPYAPDVWHGSLKEVANMGVATPADPSTWLSLDTWNWLEPAEEYYTTLVLFMPTTVGNEANYMTGTTAPKINLGINVVATQYNWEKEVDSYDKDYDKDAEYPALLAAQSPITNAFEANGVDIKKKIGNIIFGKTSEYPEIVNNYTAVSDEGGVAAYQVPNGEKYDIYYLSENKIMLPAYSRSLFQDLTNITTFDATNLDMSQVQDALCMFTNCTNLQTIKGAENWDMSNVTNMQSFFYGCNKLEDIDVSEWDTSNVTNMRMVFFRCYALDNESLKGVENWDVSNVTNFYSMFKHARGLTSLDLSNWDTSNATNMSHLFANVGGLEYLDLSGFDTSKVTDMSWMFYDASKLTTILVGDGWTTAAVDPANATCFYNNQALKGGNGTAWLGVCDMANPARPWESSAKLIYAIVDGTEGNPGLLTHK